MKVYRDLAAAASERARGTSAATVGFFDGIHIGHQRLLGELRDWARREGARAAVVTFDRHPLEVLRGVRPRPVLSLPHRLLLLAEQGVDATLALTFSPELASWSPEEFVRRGLIEGLGARYVLMGFDSAWGHRREGNYEYLSSRAERLGIELRRGDVRTLQGVRVSSTLVRDATVAGDLELLERLLGRRHSLLGRVVPGDGRGRSLGFPTANLDPEGETPLPGGVYFAEVSLRGRLDARLTGDVPRDAAAPGIEIAATFDRPGAGVSAERFGGVVNIGHRPTFEAQEGQVAVEVHLLDFERNLYGEYVEVHFLKRHRDERKFASGSELAAQIERDIAALREYLAAL